ncbi:hypothetical protein SEA_MADIBA_48 [Mycobacterium phage Madiba]|nr:hypothetical protein SEA_MADIBA_48 [Mycobacterium phage Madiba]
MSQDVIPEPRVCECGHQFRWYDIDPDPDTTSVFYEISVEAGIPILRTHEDVVERECPHLNGTVIQHCSKCGRVVDMWGMGPAGGLECECWEGRL